MWCEWEGLVREGRRAWCEWELTGEGEGLVRDGVWCKWELTGEGRGW